MLLRQYNMEPTCENILYTIEENFSGRNSALAPFLEIIDHDFISTLALNGNWGSGKTFFIKQAMLLLEYLDPTSSLDSDTRSRIDAILATSCVNGLICPQLSRSYHAVYYNAWLYDDHNDPIQSLLYFLSVTFSRNYGKEFPKLEIFSAILKTVAKWKNIDLDALADTLTDTQNNQGLLSEVKSMEDVKQALQETFHVLLGDQGSLLVFVDELDRCSPMYAVRFLERVKHFFSCPNVKFVFSTNLRQLGATIQNFYGVTFNSTRYLNKFFDFTTELPPVSQDQYLRIHRYSIDENDILKRFCINLSYFFQFSLRQLNTFLGMLDKLDERLPNEIERYKHSNGQNAVSFLFFPPLLTALSLYDQTKHEQVIAGNGKELVRSVFQAWPDGISYMRTVMPNLRDASDAEIQMQFDRLYENIFRAGHGHANYDPQDNLKNAILLIASRLY